jgi:hypothetical protein
MSKTGLDKRRHGCPANGMTYGDHAVDQATPASRFHSEERAGLLFSAIAGKIVPGSDMLLRQLSIL